MPLFRGRLPGQLIIQYSNHCNADCPQCGMRRSETISRASLDKDQTKRLIDEAAAQGVRALSLTGGEPLLFLDDIVDLINHASKAGIPYVRTGTKGHNGWMQHDLIKAAVNCLDIDGAQCRTFAMQFTWEACTDQFVSNLCFEAFRLPPADHLLAEAA